MSYLVATKGRPKTDWEIVYSLFGFWKYKLITKKHIYKVYYWHFFGLFYIDLFKIKLH